MYSNPRRYSLINLTTALFQILCSFLVVVIASPALSILVTCRSYNIGLVFYDLHTHDTYLPPTVSVSRGRSLANFKYSDKGSIWSTFGQPCECGNNVCGCCVGLQVEQYKFDQKICVNVTFVPDAEETQLEIFLNEKSSAKYGLSARDPSPFCIPVMMGVPMGMCVQMSNIQMVGNNLNMCMDFVVRLASTDLFEMHFQCMRMGLDGLQYLDKNGLPVLPQSRHDYDFFDGNSSPLDSDSNADEETSAAEYYEEMEKQQQKYEVVELDVKDLNQKKLIEEQEEQLFQINSPLTEKIFSQPNVVKEDPIVATQKSIVKNDSKMINTTINANNANNIDHGNDENHDDKVNDDNKVTVTINAQTIALSYNKDGDSNGNGNDEQRDNNSKQNELITTMTNTKTTTAIKSPTTTYQQNNLIIDEEMPNYMLQSAAATTVNGRTTVNSSTADLERFGESMAQDEETDEEDNNNDEDNDEDDEKATIISSPSSDATEENSENEINIDDKIYEGNVVEEEEVRENNDVDDQIDMIIKESVINNDIILNDANANMINERVNFTANKHKVNINSVKGKEGECLYNDDDNGNVGNIGAGANDVDSYQNSLNHIENNTTLPQLGSLFSFKIYRYIHRF